MLGLKAFTKKLLAAWPSAPDRLYRKHDYLTAYRMHTDLRVDRDPHEAVGGSWEALGALQFDFLLANDLKRTSTVLDYGCGTLRAGHHFIRFLDAGRYTGVDLSGAALESGATLIAELGLADKRALLIRNETPERPFACVGDRQFDFVLAQSVLTHLPMDIARQILADVGTVLGGPSVFFFTFNQAAEHAQTGRKTFCYPMSFFVEEANRHGYILTDRSGDYPHPDGQTMMALRRGPARQR